MTLDYTGKKAVVIGSGATAITLVPGMPAARQADHAGNAPPPTHCPADVCLPSTELVRKVLPRKASTVSPSGATRSRRG